ncbi:MAG: hypothetical protein KU29_01110 [Sulfurovum sp. FS06-10]|nr:MAG: hypothetical protein KU29_01110 [Sulfurovum sp. FS06-10]
MIKSFLLLFFLLALMIVGISLHYTTYPYAKNREKLQNIASLTQQTTPSLSVTYDEKRELFNNTSNIIYPEMPSTNTMGFVYAQ